MAKCKALTGSAVKGLNEYVMLCYVMLCYQTSTDAFECHKSSGGVETQLPIEYKVISTTCKLLHAVFFSMLPV